MEAYERILAENPRFAPAANNLAYLLSETGGDKERALQLAHVAKEAAPDEPHISDTLGWIVIDAQGYVLYRSELDANRPSRSACTGTCAQQWLPERSQTLR